MAVAGWCCNFYSRAIIRVMAFLRHTGKCRYMHDTWYSHEVIAKYPCCFYTRPYPLIIFKFITISVRNKGVALKLDGTVFISGCPKKNNSFAAPATSLSQLFDFIYHSGGP